MKAATHLCTSLCFGLTILILAGNASSGEITGRLMFDDGSPASGQVSVGVISDMNNILYTAFADMLSTPRKAVTDAAGRYHLTSVPEGVPVLVMASAFKDVDPPRTKVLNLSPGESLSNVDFVFLANAPEEVKLQGTVSINGHPPSQDIAGSVTVIKTDHSIASLRYYGQPEGRYRFTDLLPGEYQVRAEFLQPGDTLVHTTATVVIPATGAVTLNLNIQTQ